MASVRVADNRLWVDTESRPLLAGEVHYWRLRPHLWAPILKRVREMDLTVLSIGVNWEYHEVAEGRVDLRGETDPQRNLVGFLRLAADMDFWVILRPGPYYYTEWINMGVPTRVAHLHRLHPDFLAAAETYMAAIVEVARPLLASQGGNIVLWQADNEPDPWPQFYERQLGLGEDAGVFQSFLRKHFGGDIRHLNELWETDLTDFEQARAVTQPVLSDPAYLKRYRTFRQFQYWYSQEIVRWTADTFRRQGVDVPICANVYPNPAVQNWRELESVVEVVGTDYYPSREFGRYPSEHQEYLHTLRYLRTYSALPSILEFQSGIWHGWHYDVGVLPPNHYQFTALSALLAGVAGWNWYMLVNRDNWYMSPINEWGRARPELLEAFRRIVALFHEVDPPSLVKLTNTAITFDVFDFPVGVGSVPNAVAAAAYQADIDYECYDVATGRIVKPILLYAGGSRLGLDAQNRLREYVESGGHLILFQALPVFDEAQRPLNLLDLQPPNGILGGGRVQLRLGPEAVPLQTPSLFIYRYVPGEPISVERQTGVFFGEEENLHQGLPVGDRHVVGYRQARGHGSATVLGLPPSPELLLALHRWLDIPVHSRSESPGVSTAVFRGEACYVLIAVNNGDQPQVAAVHLHLALFEERAYQVRDIVTGEIDEVRLAERGYVYVRLPAKSGTALLIS